MSEAAKREPNCLCKAAALKRLLAIEVDTADVRRLTGRLRFASLPTSQRWRTSTTTPLKRVYRRFIGELATFRYLQTATNVLLNGSPGASKTHLAVRRARKAAEAGYRTYFASAADLAARSTARQLATTMRYCARTTLLITDELGSLPLAISAECIEGPTNSLAAST
jgi:DNA replication protein DnaC